MPRQRPAFAFAVAVAACWVLPAAGPAAAQEDAGVDAPPFIVRVEGAVTVTRNAVTEEAVLYAPVLDGDRLVTESGRAAVQWVDGTVLAADERTTLDIVDSHTVRARAGTMMLFARGGEGSAPLRLSTPNARLELVGAARVLVATGATDEWGDTTTVDVQAGTGRLVSDGGDLLLEAGESASVRGVGVPVFVASGVARGDGFLQWAHEAAGDLDVASGSEHLPSDLAAFGPTLDDHGTWQYDPADAWVWYPQVASTWRPYSVGVWLHAGYYGWFWAGQDPWAWPTHHYGRWGVNRHGRWYWRPDRRFGPAWVSWAIGPGYVSWCPLGWNGRPSVTPFAAWNRYDPTVRRIGVDPWHGWTTVPSRVFGARTPVHRAAVDGRTLPLGDLRAFVTQRTPPPRNPGALAMHRRDSRSAVGSPVDAGARSPAPRTATAGEVPFTTTPGAMPPRTRRSRGDVPAAGLAPGGSVQERATGAASRRAPARGYLRSDAPSGFAVPRGEHPAYAPDADVTPGREHPIYAPSAPDDGRSPYRSRRPYGPSGPSQYDRPGVTGPSPQRRPSSYDRATPFLAPQWSSPSRPAAGLPQVREGRGAAPPPPPSSAAPPEPGTPRGSVASPRHGSAPPGARAPGASPRAPSGGAPSRVAPGSRRSG